jgi:RNA polymerase sigma-70 factor, ECF subfamily
MTTLLKGESAPKGSGELDDDVDLERDRALVIRAQAGERSAFDDLYLRYYQRLNRFCLQRLNDTHDAEDTVQEAFARAWRALPDFGGDKRFYPWLSVIAWHLCTDVLRRRGRSMPVAELHPCHEISTEGCGEDVAIDAEDSALAAKAFHRLSARHQRVLNLREGSGWSYQRIADHEGVRISTVETLLWRARQALKHEFASLAGGTGRSAWIGAGLLSTATLRRLLGTVARTARHVIHAGSAATAVVGTAAGVTAVAIAISVATPSSPVARPNRAPAVSGTVSRSVTPVTSADPTSGTSPILGSGAVVPASPVGGVPGSSLSSVTGTTNGASDPAGTLYPVVDGTLGGLSASIESAAASVSQVLSQVEGVVGNAVAPNVGQVARTGTNANGLGGILNGLVQTPATLFSGTTTTTTALPGSGH